MARHLLRDCDEFTLVRFKQLTAKERHEAWLKHRREGLGGSDMATILGLNKYKTPYELWLEKTGREQPVDISDKWAIVKGNALEKELRNRFRDLHQEWECYDGTDKSLISRNHPFLNTPHSAGTLRLSDCARATNGRKDLRILATQVTIA